MSNGIQPQRRLKIYLAAGPDLEAERRELVAEVLPELNRRAGELGAAVELVDPLAGPHGGGGRGAGLERRFELIEDCRPFFIGLLGQRYGEPVTPSATLMRRHPWLAETPGASALELEFRYGALNDPQRVRGAFFYIRDPAVLERLPAERRADLKARSAEEGERREALARLIRGSGRPVVDGYHARWEEKAGRLGGLEELVERLTADLWGAIEAELAASILQDEDVQFTLYRHRRIAPGRWVPLLFFAHLAALPKDAAPDEPDPVKQVEREAKQILGERTPPPLRTDSLHPVPRGEELTVMPHMEGMTFNPPARRFLWLEHVHREEFRMCAAAGVSGRLTGTVTVLLGDLLLADIPFAVTVDPQAEEGPEAPVDKEAARPYRRIFVSYSRNDLRIVEQVERSNALGDRYLRDTRDVSPGEEWEPALLKLIDSADVFQLFWSWNSMYSPNVENEWRHALSLGRQKFVRPCYWEEPQPQDPALDLPPEELRKIEFHYLRVAAEASQPPPAETMRLPRLGTVRQFEGNRVRVPLEKALGLGDLIRFGGRRGSQEQAVERIWIGGRPQGSAAAGQVAEIEVRQPVSPSTRVYLVRAGRVPSEEAWEVPGSGEGSRPIEFSVPPGGGGGKGAGGGGGGGAGGRARVATAGGGSKGTRAAAMRRGMRPRIRETASGGPPAPVEGASASAGKPSTQAACGECAFWQVRCFERPGLGGGTEWGDRAIGCFDPQLQRAYLADLAGTPSSPATRPLASLQPESLPPFLPVATEGLRGWPAFPGDLLFGVSLSVLLEPEGYLHFPSPEALRHGLRLPPEARVALLGTAPDRVLERFWAISERSDVWRRIGRLGLEFSTGMTFSVWEGFPRFDQLFNQERNLYTYARLAGEGVPAVPFLFWADAHDRRHALSWIGEHGEVQVVGALAQFRQRAAFAGFLSELRRFEGDLGRPLHFLLVGAATAWKLKLAFSRLRSVTVATTQPIMKAIRGFETQPDLTHRTGPWPTSREELAASNVERYRAFCARLAGLRSAA